MMGIAGHVATKMMSLLSTREGMAAWLGLTALNMISGNRFSIGLVVLTTLMDAAWGIAVAVKLKQYTHSELARLTVGKLAVYGTALFTFMGIDRILGDVTTITTAVIAGAIALIELWSSTASMVILFPNFAFLRLLQKVLRGEIAGKLKVPEEEVERILDEARQKNKNNNEK